ncbi:MAG: hypothetical protein MK008_09240 [Bdellovibrionales bacterium]|nr:hypothetical protein [Bdellovibrionales bacterium]
MKQILTLIALSLLFSGTQAMALDIYSSYECNLIKVKPNRGPTYDRNFLLMPADHTHPNRIVFDIVERGNNYNRIVSYNEESEKGLLFTPKHFINPKIHIKSEENKLMIEIIESRGGSPYSSGFTVHSFYNCI